MAKKVNKIIKLQIPAGAARPGPPIGPALGAAGAPIPLFCKEFNARTQALAEGLIIPTVTRYGSFFQVRAQNSPVPVLKKAVGIEKDLASPIKQGSKLRKNKLKNAKPKCLIQYSKD